MKRLLGAILGAILCGVALAGPTTPFLIVGSTIAIDVTASSQCVQFPASGTLKVSLQAAIINPSANTVYVVVSANSATAAIPAPGSPASATPVPAGAYIILSTAGGDFSGPWVCAIASVAGPSRIYVTPGEGL